MISAMEKDFNKTKISKFSKKELLILSNELFNKNEEVTSKYVTLQKEYEILKQRQEKFEFQLNFLREQLYGSKSEKSKKTERDSEQLKLFDFSVDETCNDNEEVKEEETIKVKGFIRKKRGRKPLSDNHTIKEIVIDISNEDKACACGNEKSCIGEIITERLEIIPQKVYKLVIKRKKYACKRCEGTAEEGVKPTVVAAPAPKFLIPGGIATSSLLAHIFVQKYVDAIPFYRQEQQFLRFGDQISRQSMSSWAMKAAEQCTVLYNKIKENIKSGALINIDETTVQVLKEPDKNPSTKSYMWVMYGGPPRQKSVLFKYAPTRSGITARELLSDYSGCVQTDDYSGYKFLTLDEEYNSRIVHLPCLAHIRRKFFEIKKIISRNKKKYKKTFKNIDWILRRISRLYRFERLFAQEALSDDKLIESRTNKILPLLNDIEERVNILLPEALPSSQFASALGYAYNNIPKLKAYIALPFATPDNNAVENLIRPFAIGRKNWMFMGNPKSAQASSILYSLVQTALLNKLNPWNYLRYIFDRLPVANTEQEYNALLPWHLTSKDIKEETDLTQRPIFKVL